MRADISSAHLTDATSPWPLLTTPDTMQVPLEWVAGVGVQSSCYYLSTREREREIRTVGVDPPPAQPPGHPAPGGCGSARRTVVPACRAAMSVELEGLAHKQRESLLTPDKRERERHTTRRTVGTLRKQSTCEREKQDRGSSVGPSETTKQRSSSVHVRAMIPSSFRKKKEKKSQNTIGEWSEARRPGHSIKRTSSRNRSRCPMPGGLGIAADCGSSGTQDTPGRAVSRRARAAQTGGDRVHPPPLLPPLRRLCSRRAARAPRRPKARTNGD